MKLTRALCMLGMSGMLLAANHFPSLTTGYSPQAVSQNGDDGTQTARNASSQSVIFADDFERGTGNWHLNGDWEIQTTNGNRVLHGAGNDLSFAQAGCGGDDYRFEARGRGQSGDAGLAIRIGDYNAGYFPGL